tara:strand:+ start:1892 stop:2563 length:672 start_codon:yes stop_codon:yes gene_type:complete
MEEVMKCLTDLDGLIKNIDMRQVDDLPVEPVKPPKKLPELPSEIVNDIIYKYQPRPDYINSLKWLFNVIETKQYVKAVELKKHFKKRKNDLYKFTINGMTYITLNRYLPINSYNNIDYEMHEEFIKDGILVVDRENECYTIHNCYELDKWKYKPRYYGSLLIKLMVSYLTENLTIPQLKRITGDKTFKRTNKRQKVWEHYETIITSKIGYRTIKMSPFEKDRI